MMRKIGMALLFAGSLVATNAFSQTHTFTQGLAVEYTFPPNEPQVFENIFFWRITAVCTVISQENAYIGVKMLHKSGSFNNFPLSSGDVTGALVHPGDKLHIVADAGAKVELTNTSSQTIRANCSTA